MRFSAMGAGRARMLVAAGALVLAGLVAGVTSAQAGTYDDPFFLGWSTFLPALSSDFTASTETDCMRGSVHCVDKVIREMTQRYNTLGCDHSSMFAFTYLVTTEEYRKAVADPAFFQDNAFVNHQDAVFGDFYFKAYDAWKKGNIGAVSPAWRVAFSAADRQEVSGMGNVLLGMNAHVNRDLPFVLDAIGLTKPDGTSRKPDHDKVNTFLNAVNQYLLTEAARYLDPTVDDGDVPGTSIDNSTMVQLLVSWREAAWRNAERLAQAGSAAARAQVAQQIEDAAAYTALTLRASYLYNGVTTGTAAARNLYCASHRVSR
ncbi:MAG: DUF5995 family protein [Acidimicrobiales bacterium]